MIDIQQYRSSIGTFHMHSGKRSYLSDLFFWTFIFPNFIFRHWVLPNIIKQCNDIECNPGPPQYTTAKSIDIGHANMRSVMTDLSGKSQHEFTKMDLLRDHMIFYSYGIMGISETWLDESIDTHSLIVPGYQAPIRRDQTRHSGGSMVYIAEGLPAVHKPEYEPTHSEIICVEVRTQQQKILICNCYRPQHRDIVDFCSDVNTIIDEAATYYNSVVFMGDMNCRNTLFWGPDTTNTEGRALKAQFDSHDYDQLIHEPTRVVNNCQSCIDLLFINNPSIISEVGTRPKIHDPKCDHKPIYAKVKCTLPRQQCYKRWVWDYKNGDYDKFRWMLLNAPWYDCYITDNVDEIVNAWLDMFLSIAKKCIPHYECTIRPRDKDFMNSDIRKLMKERDRTHKLKKTNPNPQLQERYRVLRNQVLSDSRKAKFDKDKELDKILSSPDVSSKQWWKHCKSTTTRVNDKSINSPLFEGNTLVTDNTEKANLFNRYFVSQSELDDSKVKLPDNHTHPNPTINQKVIDPVDVYSVLVNLDIDKATGPDGISNKLLLEAAVPIAEPLSHLYNYSLSAGIFPDVWKIANVIPVFKKNDPKYCNNYRPISLLCCISKVFERLLFDHIFLFLKKNKLLNPNQSGFIPKDSTINQLLHLCHKIHQSMDTDDEIIAIFLDLSKAFDKVWHKGLLYKVHRIGISGNLLKWIQSYLEDRRQKVALNGSFSETLSLSSGVPQGSVLGPLLFLIYINDISDNLTGETFLFADDSSLFHKINKNINRCIELVNHDLEAIDKWSEQWLVTINVTKTVCMLFSRSRPNFKLPPIRLGNNYLTQVYNHTHLGLKLTPNLSWNGHIQELITKANNRLSLLKRYKYRLSRKALEICYVSFVRPLLEYGDVLFDACTKKEAIELEAVQISAAQLVTGAKRRSSHELLYKELGWQSLQIRRYIHKMTKIYDIVNGHTPVYLTKLVEKGSTRTQRADNIGNLKIPLANKCLFEKSFFIEAIKAWNKLPSKVKTAESKHSFKHCISTPLTIQPNLTPCSIQREGEIIISQLRIGFSDLNDHLFEKGCTDSPACECGHAKEDARHLFFSCPLYNTIRQNLFTELSNMNLPVPISLKLLLYGNPQKLTSIMNNNVFKCVSEYVLQTKRFLSFLHKN